MIKKIATIAFCATMTVPAFTPQAQAASLTDAFGSLLTPGGTMAVTSPGRYQSGARNSFVAGGMEMRFPRSDTTAKMFSFSPPKISAGCNGVSAHFGGFSFISGKEFEQMVRGIASGAALGFVTMIGIKGLCPICADVIQQLKNAAQLASRLAIDSCKIGQELYNKFNGEETDFTTTLCGSTTSESGGTNDFLSAISNTCNSIAGALDGLKESAISDPDSPEGKAQEDELQCKAGVGNVTWGTLKGAGTYVTEADKEDVAYARRIILMNMMGASLRHDGQPSSCETATGVQETDENSRKNVYCPPTVAAKDINGLFMCGSDIAAINKLGSETVSSYCRQFYNGLSVAGGTSTAANITQLMVCVEDESRGSNLANCRHMKLENASKLKQIAGEGFLPRVARLLQLGVEAVRNPGEHAGMPKEVLELMEVVPFPLYQAINAAAVYPVAASDLLDSISILVAESATGVMMNEFLRWHGKEGGHACSSEQQVKRILETVETSRALNGSMKNMVAQNMIAQNAIKEQIRSLNLAIQQQVMTTDLLQQNQMAQSISRAIAPNSRIRNPEGGRFGLATE